MIPFSEKKADYSETNRLWVRVRRGDRDAWGRLVERFEALVYSVPRRMNLSLEDCADVFQNTFLALYRNIDRIEAPEALPKWLSVTATREALRLKRLSSRAPTVELDAEGNLDELLLQEDAIADSLVLAALKSEEIRTAIQKLPERCQKLLELLYFSEDAGYSDVTERLGMPSGAIGPTRGRCLEKLRRELERAGFFDDP